MNNIKVVRDNTYNNMVVFIDGPCNSGKSLISRILEGYERVEKSEDSDLFYWLCNLWRFRKLDEDVAIALIKLEADLRIYNLMIGRCINTRPSDVTSLEKYPFKSKYKERMLIEEHYTITEKISKERPILQNMISNAMGDIDIFLKAFEDRLRYIYVKRHPTDLIYNIWARGFGDRISEDPSERQFSLRWNKYSVPTYTHDWEKEYIGMSSMNRVVRMVSITNNYDNDGYNKLNKKQRKQVKIIKFEDIASDPIPYCKDLEDFIGSKMTKEVYNILVKERCPRVINIKQREEMEEEVKDALTPDNLKLYNEMIFKYEQDNKS
jgi:hypothetical protein